jgi:DNA-directed RNA polymerase subunit RPC12/RpoP
MSSQFVYEFVAVLMGAAAFHAVASVIDGRRPTPASRAAASPIQYSRPILLLIAVHSQVGAFFAAATITAALVLSSFFVRVDSMLVLVFVPYLMMIVFLCLNAVIRCDACGRKMLLNYSGRAPFGERSRNLTASGNLVWTIARNPSFRCPQCGQRLLVRGPS